MINRSIFSSVSASPSVSAVCTPPPAKRQRLNGSKNKQSGNNINDINESNVSNVLKKERDMSPRPEGLPTLETETIELSDDDDNDNQDDENDDQVDVDVQLSDFSSDSGDHVTYPSRTNKNNNRQRKTRVQYDLT